VALLFAAGSVAELAGLLDGGWVPVAVAVAVLIAGLVALSLDVWGGGVVGLVTVAGLVAVRRGGSAWTRDDFAAATVEALAITLTGAAAGLVGSRLRRVPGDELPRSAWEPTYGSLGLLGADAGMARLEEETRRARRTGRPVTVALLEVVVTDTHLSREEHAAAVRTVARMSEGRAGEDDLPFALAESRVGIIFPEAGASAAYDAVGQLLQACSTAEFTFGRQRAPRRLTELVEVYVGISQYGPGRDSWETLLDAASQALARARDEGQAHDEGRVRA
jgi:GGDEF domain-containing protein